MNGFACAKIHPVYAIDRYSLICEADQMHFDTRPLTIKKGLMGEILQNKIGAELVIDTNQNVLVESPGDASGIVIGTLEFVDGFGEVNAKLFINSSCT